MNLATFRRSGEAVVTPVWFAPLHGHFYVFTAAPAGKVKRLRRSNRARVSPCDMRGRPLGDWVEARAVLVCDAGEQARAYAAIRARYGWQMWITDVFSRLTGRIHRRAVIRVTLALPGCPDRD
jgi:PPOX class probable F420-dependent enzyme